MSGMDFHMAGYRGPGRGASSVHHSVPIERRRPTPEREINMVSQEPKHRPESEQGRREPPPLLKPVADAFQNNLGRMDEAWKVARRWCQGAYTELAERRAKSTSDSTSPTNAEETRRHYIHKILGASDDSPRQYENAYRSYLRLAHAAWAAVDVEHISPVATATIRTAFKRAAGCAASTLTTYGVEPASIPFVLST